MQILSANERLLALPKALFNQGPASLISVDRNAVGLINEINNIPELSQLTFIDRSQPF